MASGSVSPAPDDSANLPSLGGGAASLAQSARLKQLKLARGILLFIGICTIVVNGLQVAFVEKIIDGEIDKEIAQYRQQGMEIDPVAVEELRQSAYRAGRLIGIGLVGLGVLYIVMSFLVKAYPVPVTIIALVLYIGTTVIFALLDPATIAQGIIVKIIIVVALAKAIQAAIAFEKSRSAPTALTG